MAKISQSQLRTIVLIFLVLITALVQFAQTGQILGVNITQPTATQVVFPAPSPLPSPVLDTDVYEVVSVTDGDTFKVMIGSEKKTVRIVGIDTPETVDPRQPVQCFGQEASARLKSLLTGQRVKLESDATQQNTDRYGRLLRFVFLTDGTDVGKKMIEDGFAQESLYSKVPHTYRETYLAAQADAKLNQRGLWAADACEE